MAKRKATHGLPDATHEQLALDLEDLLKAEGYAATHVLANRLARGLGAKGWCVR